ncbi:MAG: tetratricopeptide repeat protein [Planctomycetota bacterium]
MNRPSRLRSRPALALTACLTAAATALVGCSGSGSSGASPAVGGTVAEARELTARGDRAFQEADYEQAESLYRRSLSIMSDQPGALNNLGNVLVAQQRYLDADEVYKLAIEIDSTRPEIFSNRGRLYLQAGYPRDAIRIFDQALDADPRWMPAIRGKAKASHVLGLAENEYLGMLRQAMILESDAAWRAFFDSERARVRDALLAEEDISSTGSF